MGFLLCPVLYCSVVREGYIWNRPSQQDAVTMTEQDSRARLLPYCCLCSLIRPHAGHVSFGIRKDICSFNWTFFIFRKHGYLTWNPFFVEQL